MPRSTKEERVAYLKALCRTIPYTIVEAVLANPTERSIGSRTLEGTLLHADIVGFTALCESVAQSGADGLVRLTRALNDLFARLLEESFFPYEGYVLHFAGDAVTVLFRGPQAELRAAAAALYAQKLMREELGALLGEEGRDLLLRIGLARGEVLLAIVGDLTQRAVVCSGPVGHRAVELQQRALPGTVLADRAVVEALGRAASFGPVEGDRAPLLDLPRWPPRQPIAELAGRVEEDTERKIALLEPFVATPLAARLKSTPGGWRIEGELREVVILFSDVSGLSSPRAGAEATDLSRSLLRAFRKYGGLLAKVDLCRQGHRLMVLFGLHMPAGNDPERAVLAALEATARMRGFAADGDGPVVRSGIHLGQVYYGAFGSDWRHDITVIGDAVNLAARAAESAGPLEVVATDAVLARTGSAFSTSARGALRVKGRAEGLGLRVVHGAAEGRARYLRRRSQPRFLAGRSLEVTLLRQHLERALAGQSQVLGIRGAAGTGKSAILSDLVDEWIGRGGTGLLGRCRYSTRTEPLAPIVSMFSAAFGIAGGDSDGDRRERIREGLAELSEASPELVELMQPVRRPDGTSEAVVDFADTHARERVLEAVLRYLERRVAGGPMLYVLEDLHLADGLTLELAVRIASHRRAVPMLCLATYRPDPTVEAFRRAVDAELSLEPLASAQCEDLVCHELGATSADSALVAFLQRRTGGNPGHLAEVVRFLRERGLLPVRAGLATVPEGGVALLDDVVPPTAATVALARLDGLGEIERRLLRTASAFGGSFSREQLEEVASAEVGPERFVAALENLEDSRFIGLEGPGHGFAFRDEVTRAVAYGTMPEPRRREVHRRIADALARRPDFDPRRHSAALAMHRERAGQAAEAAPWYRKAAHAAFQAGLDEDALNLCERWERCVGDAEGSGDAMRMGLLKLALLGRRRRQAETLRQGRELMARFGRDLDPVARQVVASRIGAALVGLGQQDKARERLGRVFEAAREPRVRCEAALELARSLALSWNAVPAFEWVERAEALLAGEGALRVRAALLREELRRITGNPAAAREALRSLAAELRRAGRPSLAARAVQAAARCELHLGEKGKALAGFEEALRQDRAVGGWVDIGGDLLGIGQALFWDRRAQEAREPLEKALRYAQEQSDAVTAAEATVHLGACVALTSDPGEGMALCVAGAKLAAQTGSREAQLAANLHLLRIALMRRERKSAGALYARCREDQKDHRTPLFKAAFAELAAQAEALLAQKGPPVVKVRPGAG